MSITKPLGHAASIRFLVITAQGYDWIDELRHQVTNVALVADEADYREALASAQYDIVLYDDATFNRPLLTVLEEIRLQTPHALIAVISDGISNQTYDEIINAGGADAIASSHGDDNMMQRISALMRQALRNAELAHRTRRLHAINLLAQKLHDARHPTLMIASAIDMICNYFDVYAVAITIAQDGYYQLYAGTDEDRRRIYETKVEMQPENPLRQIIDTRMSLIFPNVTKHPYFKSIPIIKDPQSSVIVPIKHGAEVLGSLALFARNTEYVTADVPVIELLGSNLGTAYQNVKATHSREIDAQSMEYVLDAWPELNAAYNRPQIAQIIHDYILNIETVKAVGIWLFSQLNGAPGVVYSDFNDLMDSLKSIRDDENLQSIAAEFEESMQPRIYARAKDELTILKSIFDVMGTPDIMLVPIAGNGFEGVMVLTSQSNQTISSTDLGLIENLARVAANVIERNTLIESLQTERHKLQEQTGRVEGVLRSIDEGIFFINDSHQVVYSNPQFSELTGIAPSQVLDQPFSHLFTALARISPESQIYEQLMHAATQVGGQGDEQDDAYPFVEIETLTGQNMVVEFMRVDTSAEQRGWIGVIAQREDSAGGLMGQQTMLQNMLDDMTTPIIELNNTTMTLQQQYDLLSASNFETLLERLEDDMHQMQSMWANFVQIYKGETEGIQVRATSVDPTDFVETVLTNRRMALFRRQIRFQSSTDDAIIRIDERQMRQCFINLVEFLSSISNRGAPIFVEITTEGQQVIISLQEKTTILSDSDISNIFTPKRDSDMKDDLYPHRLGMYLARQIVMAHGGQLNVSSMRGVGLSVRLALPISTDEEETIIPMLDENDDNLEETATIYRPPTRGLTMSIMESRSNFVTNLYSQMQTQGHEVIPVPNIDDVLFDLSMTRVDIVIIEVDRANIGIIGYVQRIRAQSEVPIVIITLPEFEDDCLQALAHGADDYFIVPFNEDKLLAQLYAISKRQDMASRTAEPIKVGDLEIDFSRRRVYLGNTLINLTAKEYELLRVLAMNKGQVMSHKRLLAKVWGPEHENETQYLWVNISRLRRKLEPDKDSPRYIQNEPRVGYVFTAEAD